MIHNEAKFDTLIQSALAQGFSGWDFSYIKDRCNEHHPPWDYATLVREQMAGTTSMLDMGTGGGEMMASLAPLPPDTHATEGWEKNIPIARQKLTPMGVTVHGVEDKDDLPFEGIAFDLVINRHAGFSGSEVFRILKPGGVFLTQQVGGQNYMRLNELLSGEQPTYVNWTLEGAQQELIDAGFEIIRAEEAFPPVEFFDIGAVVFYLSVITWQIPDFSVEKHRAKLAEIHNIIESDGKLVVNQHRFLIIAHKPIG